MHDAMHAQSAHNEYNAAIADTALMASKCTTAPTDTFTWTYCTDCVAAAAVGSCACAAAAPSPAPSHFIKDTALEPAPSCAATAVPGWQGQSPLPNMTTGCEPQLPTLPIIGPQTPTLAPTLRPKAC